MKAGLKLFVVMAVVTLMFSAGCDKESKELTFPTVTTAEVTDITQSGAACGGEVTFDGNDAAVTRGICWSNTPAPTIADNIAAGGSGEGAFTAQITGLAPNVTYYVRAWATNSHGTAYGAEKEFKTPL